MAIRYSAEERAAVQIGKAIEKRARKEAQKGRPKLDKGPERDRDYIAWLHHGIQCFACLIEGRPTGVGFNPIEAAHIWLLEGAMKGLRNSDHLAMPICRVHHREGRDCCDVAQRKFFDRLGVDPLTAHQTMYGAFLAGRDGWWAAHQIAAAANPPARKP